MAKILKFAWMNVLMIMFSVMISVHVTDIVSMDVHVITRIPQITLIVVATLIFHPLKIKNVLSFGKMKLKPAETIVPLIPSNVSSNVIKMILIAVICVLMATPNVLVNAHVTNIALMVAHVQFLRISQISVQH